MLKALDKGGADGHFMVCTGHGPVLVGDRIKSVMKQYRGVVHGGEPEPEENRSSSRM